MTELLARAPLRIRHGKSSDLSDFQHAILSSGLEPVYDCEFKVFPHRHHHFANAGLGRMVPISRNHVHAFHTIWPSHLLAYTYATISIIRNVQHNSIIDID